MTLYVLHYVSVIIPVCKIGSVLNYTETKCLLSEYQNHGKKSIFFIQYNRLTLTSNTSRYTEIPLALLSPGMTGIQIQKNKQPSEQNPIVV